MHFGRYSLDNFLLKNVIVFVLGNQISKWRSFEKRAVFHLLFTILSHKGKDKTILQHISHFTQICILLSLLTFLPYQFCKNYEFITYGFFFGVIQSPWCVQSTIPHQINSWQMYLQKCHKKHLARCAMTHESTVYV